MTTAQVVETSVTVNNNSPIQDYIHQDDHTQPLFKFFNQQTLQSSAENLQTVMITTDGRDNDILDKQGVETDAKDRKETLKDTLQSSNRIRESQETLSLREDENEQQAKITVHTIEEAMTTTEERTPVSVWYGARMYSLSLPKSQAVKITFTRLFWRLSHLITSLYF